jgi:hypothetical protein
MNGMQVRGEPKAVKIAPAVINFIASFRFIVLDFYLGTLKNIHCNQKSQIVLITLKFI